MQLLQLLGHASIATVLLCIGTQAFAESEPVALVDQQHCMFCHIVDSPFLAPPFQRIAERYRNVSNAASILEIKLRLVAPRIGAIWQFQPLRIAVVRFRERTPTLVQWVLSN